MSVVNTLASHTTKRPRGIRASRGKWFTDKHLHNLIDDVLLEINSYNDNTSLEHLDS